jgi:two-component system C4-dicarboxylate transport sensor histidine kinase DctB
VKAAFAEPDRSLIRSGAMERGTDCGYGQLMSDIFHDLSQPLSTLTCLLEINLLLSRTAKQWRQDLKIALKQVRSIVWLFHALRELWEAGSAPQGQEVLSVAVCLREMVADLLPVAESAKVKLFVASSSDCPVSFQASRLRQGLTHLLDFAIQSCADGAEVKITAREEGEAARVRVAISTGEISVANDLAEGSTAEAAEWKQHDLKRRLGIAVAWRVFESGGGILHAEESEDRLCLEVVLPLASSCQAESAFEPRKT